MEKTETLICINWLVSIVASALYYCAVTAFVNDHPILGAAFIAVTLASFIMPTPKWGYLTLWRSVKVDVVEE